MPEIEFGTVKVGQSVVIKGQQCTVTEVKVLSAKRGQVNKVKIVGRNEAGEDVSITKPENRTISTDGKEAVVKKSADGGEEEEHVEQVDLSIASSAAGASKTIPVRAGEIRKGHFVCLKGKPCKVIAISVSKTGKHGHAKANITGLDVFTGRKYVEICPTSHNMVAPAMFRSEWQLTDISKDGNMTLMDQGGNMKEDLDLPRDTHGEYTELSQSINEKFASCEPSRGVFVTVLQAMDTEQVVDMMVKDVQ
jgi:translation initiation factor 5A